MKLDFGSSFRMMNNPICPSPYLTPTKAFPKPDKGKILTPQITVMLCGTEGRWFTVQCMWLMRAVGGGPCFLTGRLTEEEIRSLPPPAQFCDCQVLGGGPRGSSGWAPRGCGSDGWTRPPSLGSSRTAKKGQGLCSPEPTSCRQSWPTGEENVTGTKTARKLALKCLCLCLIYPCSLKPSCTSTLPSCVWHVPTPFQHLDFFLNPSSSFTFSKTLGTKRGFVSCSYFEIKKRLFSITLFTTF